MLCIMLSVCDVHCARSNHPPQSGPGRVVGVHNGDAKSHEPQHASTRHAYHGLARAVVKVRGEVPFNKGARALACVGLSVRARVRARVRVCVCVCMWVCE
jgi:hypothetical protein